MTNAGLPVPPGFTISTDACNLYYEQRQQAARQHRSGDRREPAASSKRPPAPRSAPTTNPLLVSVRSGAKFSMPGMMDTILNLGLNDDAVEGLEGADQNGRFAFDSYRRFMQMFGSVVLEIPEGGVRARVRGDQEGQGREARHRPRRGRAARGRRGVQGRRQEADAASRSRRIRWTSCGWRATPCSARGTTRAPRNTAASTTSPIRSAPPSTSR